MPRKRRERGTDTHLSRFLIRLLSTKKITLRAAAEIAGCSPSVVSDWKQGGYPSTPDTVKALQRLCNFHGVGLSLALTGEAEASSSPVAIEQLGSDAECFEGLLHVTIKRLKPTL